HVRIDESRNQKSPPPIEPPSGWRIHRYGAVANPRDPSTTDEDVYVSQRIQALWRYDGHVLYEQGFVGQQRSPCFAPVQGQRRGGKNKDGKRQSTAHRRHGSEEGRDTPGHTTNGTYTGRARSR